MIWFCRARKRISRFSPTFPFGPCAGLNVWEEMRKYMIIAVSEAAIFAHAVSSLSSNLLSHKYSSRRCWPDCLMYLALLPFNFFIQVVSSGAEVSMFYLAIKIVRTPFTRALCYFYFEYTTRHDYGSHIVSLLLEKSRQAQVLWSLKNNNKLTKWKLFF